MRLLALKKRIWQTVYRIHQIKLNLNESKDKIPGKILKKIGEECTEVIIAGKANDKAETIYEISDLMYHVLVLMIEMGISVDDIKKRLNKICELEKILVEVEEIALKAIFN